MAAMPAAQVVVPTAALAVVAIGVAAIGVAAIVGLLALVSTLVAAAGLVVVATVGFVVVATVGFVVAPLGWRPGTIPRHAAAFRCCLPVQFAALLALVPLATLILLSGP